MDWQSIAVGVLGVVCTVLGWLARELWDAVKKLRQDLESLRLHLAEQYTKKEDLRDRLSEVMQPLRDSLSKIERWIERQEGS